MSLREFDWKNFLLMKGERIGLGICVLTTLVLIVMSLFMPNHGFFTGSGVANAAELNKLIQNVKSLLTNNRPEPYKEAQKDNESPPPATKVDLYSEKIKDRNKFQLAELFLAPRSDQLKRRVPELLLPDEGKVTVVLAQLKRYIFNQDYTKIMMLKGAGRSKAPGVSQVPAAFQQRNRRGRAGGAGGGEGGGEGMGAGMGFGVNMSPQGVRGNPSRMPGTGTGVASEKSTRTELEYEFVPIERIGDTANAHLAESVLPLRMAIVRASFPYRKEIEEFRKQLQLPDATAVLTETSQDSEGRTLPSFRFLGVKAQRRIVDSEGKSLSNWENIDLVKSYKPFLILCGKRTELESGNLGAISFNGLVMRRLQQFREGQYPEVETDLENIKKTLDALNTKEPEQIVTPSIFDTEQFDIFGAGETPTAPAGTGMRAAEGGGRPPAGAAMRRQPGAGPEGADGPGIRPGGGRPRGAAPVPAVSEGNIPEHCLVRLIDVTIEPGKIYQYRIQVRMANPNYQRPDVASPNYATDKELTTEDRWFEIPDKVLVPPELLFYAVDQRDVDTPLLYRGPYAKEQRDKERQAAMQIHKWLENVDDQSGFRPVGEWVVAERLLVYRGEYISRKLRCEVPEWKSTREEFILASEATPRGSRAKRESGITIDFSQPGNDAMLVDFEGGELLHEREGGRTDDRGRKLPPLRDKAPEEVLILSPEGKLQSRDAAVDANDKVRTQRLGAYRERINDVREAKLSMPGVGPGQNNKQSPFGARRGGEE